MTRAGTEPGPYQSRRRWCVETSDGATMAGTEAGRYTDSSLDTTQGRSGGGVRVGGVLDPVRCRDGRTFLLADCADAGQAFAEVGVDLGVHPGDEPEDAECTGPGAPETVTVAQADHLGADVDQHRDLRQHHHLPRDPPVE